MKKLFLCLIGFLPLGVGFTMNWFMMQYQDSVLPYRWIGICLLLCWAGLGFFTYHLKESAKVSACAVHLAALIALLLNVYQEVVLGRYWGNLLSVFTQFFYLPVLNISFTLTSWSSHVWVAYIAGFLLMCSAYLIGFNLGRLRNK